MSHPEDHIDTDIQKKLAFLNQLLERNSDLKNQFNEFMAGPAPDPLEMMDVQSFIMDESATFKEILDRLDLDDLDWNLYNPPYGYYIPEYEAREQVAEGMIKEEFDDLDANINGLFSDAKFQYGLLSLVGAYDACYKTEIHDPYETLYNIVEVLLSRLKKLQSSVIEQLDRTIIPDHQIFCFMEGLLDYYEHGQNTVLRFFEPLVLALLREKKHTQYLISLIQKKNIPSEHMPRIATEIFRLSGDREKWIKTAKSLIHQDIDVARNLPGMKKRTQELAGQLFHWKPVLPALRWVGSWRSSALMSSRSSPAQGAWTASAISRAFPTI